MVRRLLVSLVSGVVVSLLTSCSACTDQFDPSKDKARFEKEREEATAAVNASKLTKTGELPQAGSGAFDIEERYTTLCSSCHGAKGQGDGPGSVALNPKPRNFTDAAWQAATNDDRIASVIKNGGASVGLSAVMPPWGATLGDAEIKAMIGKIRAFKN